MNLRTLAGKLPSLLKSNKKTATDLLYTFGALVLMNGVLQLAIYPYINKTLGQEEMGNIVFYMSIVYIIGQAIGMSFCSNRQVLRRRFDATNDDYNYWLRIFVPLGMIAGGIYMAFYMGAAELSFFIVILGLTALRYYANVEYRLRLNYKGYFMYFVILTAGYVAGGLIFMLTGQWYYIFLVGEGAIVLFMFIRGTIFKPQARTENTAQVGRNVTILMFSYLLNNLINNTDKILIQTLVGAESVTVFYVVSMLGKTLALLVGPINNVTLSHLSGSATELTRKVYFKRVALYLGVGVLFYGVCLVGTPLYIRFFYPDIVSQAAGLNVIVNAGQVLNFSASLAIVLILASLGSKFHFILQLVYAAVYFPLAILLTQHYGILGFAWAMLIVNVFRVAQMLWLGLRKLPRDQSDPGDTPDPNTPAAEEK